MFKTQTEIEIGSCLYNFAVEVFMLDICLGHRCVGGKNCFLYIISIKANKQNCSNTKTDREMLDDALILITVWNLFEELIFNFQGLKETNYNI